MDKCCKNCGWWGRRTKYTGACVKKLKYTFHDDCCENHKDKPQGGKKNG